MENRALSWLAMTGLECPAGVWTHTSCEIYLIAATAVYWAIHRTQAEEAEARAE